MDVHIWHDLGGLRYQLTHVYREVNSVADFLPSYAVQCEMFSDFSASGLIDTAGRLLLHQDQRMLPTARLRRVPVCA